MHVSIETLVEDFSREMEALIENDGIFKTILTSSVVAVGSSFTLYDLQMVVKKVNDELKRKYEDRLATVSAEAAVTPTSDVSVRVIVELR